MADDAKLIQRFVDCFQRLDDSTYTHDEPPPPELNLGPDPDDWNALRWAPAAITTPTEALNIFPFTDSLPKIYLQIVLSYRWVEVDLHLLRFGGNPPGDGLQLLSESMFSDPVLTQTLKPNGYIRFGMAADCYDPICFDLNRALDGDCPVVQIDHESVLTHGKIGDVVTLFDTFRELVLAVLELDNET